MRLRLIWSSQTLVPASVRAASRSFTPTVVPTSAPRPDPVHRLARQLHRVLRRDAEMLVHVLRRTGLAERAHPEEQPVVADPAVPTLLHGGLNCQSRPARSGKYLLAVRLVLLHEAVH